MQQPINELLIEASNRLNIELPLLKAVCKVESNGKGFIQNVPTVLFERHVFYKKLKAKGIDADALSEKHPSLVNQESGAYVGGVAENYRLKMAKQIDEEAAIESTSFGLFQIMGFHYKTLGFASQQEFESKMSESETEQTKAFICFIEKNKNMIKALQEYDYATFAKLYNGAGYKKNQYDKKIQEAYELYSQTA